MPTIFEIVILAVFALLAIFGFIKGFARILLGLLEFFSYVLAWVLLTGPFAEALKTKLFPRFTQSMVESLSSQAALDAEMLVSFIWAFIAFWVLFLVVRLVFALIGSPIKRNIRKGRPIRRWDRGFGFAFLTIILIAVTAVLMAVFQNIETITNNYVAGLYPLLNGAVGRMLKPTIDKLPEILNSQVVDGLFLKLIAGDKNLLGNLVIGLLV